MSNMKQYAKLLWFLLVMVVAIPVIRVLDRVLKGGDSGKNQQ